MKQFAVKRVLSLSVKVSNTYISSIAHMQAKAKIQGEQLGGETSQRNYLSALRWKMSERSIAVVAQVVGA